MGLIQLLAQGAQDHNLVGNPQMSFYKIVYRRYTNFSVESKTLNMVGNNINETSSVTLDCEIKRNADLLSNLYFTFDLPDIYSGCYPDNYNFPRSNVNPNKFPYEFRWVENIGTNIIDEVKFMLNDTVVTSFEGQYMQVMSELMYTDSQKKIYNEMTGNVPEMYRPSIYYKKENINNRAEYIAYITTPGTGYNAVTDATDNSAAVTHRGQYQLENIGGVVTHAEVRTVPYNTQLEKTLLGGGGDSTIKLMYSNYPHVTQSPNNDIFDIHSNHTSRQILPHSQAQPFGLNLENRIPSIRKRNIKVPLNLFFSKSSGTALPLVALQYTQSNIEIKLNPLTQLYTILDYVNNNNNVPIDQQPVRSRPDENISLDLFTDPNNPFNLNPRIEAEYVFLDTEERKRFAVHKHDYLIEEVQTVTLRNITSTQDHNIKINHPVKEIIIVSQRTDMESVNSWNNYSNWAIENIPPYSYEYNRTENMLYDINTQDLLFYNNRNAASIKRQEFHMKHFTENIIKNLKFSFNGTIRLDKKDSDYFNKLQPLQHHKRKIKNGIHVYSFSLNPDEYQPSGACNFSRIDDFKINIDLGIENNIKELPLRPDNTNYFNYTFKLYAINYNILTIASGLGAKQYVN